MAALDFPHLGLSIGQTYPNPAVSGQPVYTWDGEKWTSGTGFGNIYISDSAPAAPAGSLWWESDTGILGLERRIVPPQHDAVGLWNGKFVRRDRIGWRSL